MEIKLKDLLEAGCHFGHQVTRWNPKMKPYIFTAREKVHIFDLAKTKEGLEAASVFVKTVSAQNGKIIFIGTKRQAQEIIKKTAVKVGMPYVSERWIGGTLTNWDRIKKNIEKLAELKSGKESGEFKNYTKKENLLIDRKIARLEHIFGGLAELKGLPEALFIIDLKKEIGAAREARAVGIKVIGLVDSNSDPEFADFVIPANDDAVKSIQFVVEVIAGAVEEGKKGGKTEKASKALTEEVKKEEEVSVKEEVKKSKITKEKKAKNTKNKNKEK